jgi:hypothetical protein
MLLLPWVKNSDVMTEYPQWYSGKACHSGIPDIQKNNTGTKNNSTPEIRGIDETPKDIL